MIARPDGQAVRTAIAAVRDAQTALGSLTTADLTASRFAGLIQTVRATQRLHDGLANSPAAMLLRQQRTLANTVTASAVLGSVDRRNFAAYEFGKAVRVAAGIDRASSPAMRAIREYAKLAEPIGSRYAGIFAATARYDQMAAWLHMPVRDLLKQVDADEPAEADEREAELRDRLFATGTWFMIAAGQVSKYAGRLNRGVATFNDTCEEYQRLARNLLLIAGIIYAIAHVV